MLGLPSRQPKSATMLWNRIVQNPASRVWCNATSLYVKLKEWSLDCDRVLQVRLDFAGD